MVRADARLLHQFGGCAGAGHGLHGQFHDPRQSYIALCERIKHGFTKSALRPVVFYGHNKVARFCCSREERFFVDGLDGVGVDDTRTDALALELS